MAYHLVKLSPSLEYPINQNKNIYIAFLKKIGFSLGYSIQELHLKLKSNMTPINIKREVAAVLVDMGIAEKAITEKANFSKDLGLDSLDFVEMVMEFELRFNISIPTTEAEKICTVKQAIDYLNKVLHRKIIA